MKLAICFLTTSDYHFNIKMLKQQIKKSVLHNIDLYIYVDSNNKDNYTVDGIYILIIHILDIYLIGTLNIIMTDPQLHLNQAWSFCHY